MFGLPQPEERSHTFGTAEQPRGPESKPPDEGKDPKSTRNLDEHELGAALQLLVERAQYITGATGAALALPHADEMVCHASAGSCAPAVGVCLQVRSGLTGESIARRQLLRCDNAETDPRVNLETCRALGIASIVVLPLLRPSGEVRGLFELFSDHPYAFEERDLIALERMAALTLTALDLSDQRNGSALPIPRPKPAEPSVETTDAIASVAAPEAVVLPAAAPAAIAAMPAPTPAPQPAVQEAAVETFPPAATTIPDAMLRVQKCASCGFPVSEGRALCLDCESKGTAGVPVVSPEASTALAPAEDLPPFLANPLPENKNWLAQPVNILAVLVVIVGILLAIVVFR